MQAHRFGSLFLCLALLLLAGCRGLSLPPAPAGVALQPGQYLAEYYAAPDFTPARLRYHLAPFTVEAAQDVDSAAFLRVFQAELARAFEANGLALAGTREADCRVAGVVHRVRVSSAWRFLRGRISGELQVSGTFTRGPLVVSAFRDSLRLTSPLAPGPAAPQEAELLLRQLSRAFAQRLLNQLLLYGLAASG